MMNLDQIAQRFDKAKRLGPERIRACCSAHDDKTPSLDITTGSDGRILLICRAGCDTRDVLEAAGLTWADVMPPSNFTPSERKAWKNRTQRGKLLLALRHERLIIELARTKIGPFIEEDAERISKAFQRIRKIKGALREE